MVKQSKYTFFLPCYMQIGRKRISLNLNWYRNAHYMLLNKTKQAYCPTRFGRFKASRVHIDYTLVLDTNRRTDFMNWITIADKYFLDWLVSSEMIPDDCVKNYGSLSASAVIDTEAKESYILAVVFVLE